MCDWIEWPPSSLSSPIFIHQWKQYSVARWVFVDDLPYASNLTGINVTTSTDVCDIGIEIGANEGCNRLAMAIELSRNERTLNESRRERENSLRTSSLHPKPRPYLDTQLNHDWAAGAVPSEERRFEDRHSSHRRRSIDQDTSDISMLLPLRSIPHEPFVSNPTWRYFSSMITTDVTFSHHSCHESCLYSLTRWTFKAIYLVRLKFTWKPTHMLINRNKTTFDRGEGKWNVLLIIEISFLFPALTSLCKQSSPDNWMRAKL